jgi:hypothetical protein
MDLTTLRARLRQDLHDEDETNYRWTDDVLDRHIGRAVREYSQACPRLASVTLQSTGSRRFDLTDETGLLWIREVEYPVDATPIRRLPFRMEVNGWAYLFGDSLPAAGESVKFWYAAKHILDEDGSTLPPEHEELVALGAAGFAAVESANYAIGRLNANGRAPEWYRTWGEARLREFWQRLDGLRAGAGASPVAGGWKLGARS